MTDDEQKTEQVMIRMTPTQRKRVEVWRQRHNRDAANPMSEADAMRLAIRIGLDHMEHGAQ